MEENNKKKRVVIIGAGPAGLTLALALAQQGLASTILEKELEITQDPRGVYLAADAVRILYALGLEKHMPVIGHVLDQVQFHRSSFVQTPFHVVNLIHDKLHQAVPNGILQIQPALERALRSEVDASSLCDLQLGCEVRSLTELKDGVRVTFTAHSSSETRQIDTAWLIGADGKTGIVRKHFLEPLAGIRQVETAYRYEGTWVASNLRIANPTPESHPDLPFWDLGMTPEEVYDLYWPKGWHFCSPPAKSTASGRFGPHESHLWRHEFREDNWSSTSNAEELLWEHLTPMITRSISRGTEVHAVMYPKDCIEILRCRPFTFCHKLVNRWFSGRTILIGDAAHVFPPFGGQGIASGIRDAHQLAWRLALCEARPASIDADAILTSWSQERTKCITDAANLTWINGLLCNESNPVLQSVVPILHWSLKYLGLDDLFPLDPQLEAERKGFREVQDGFFISRRQGGLKMPQICVDTLFEKRLLSDQLMTKTTSIFKLVVLADAANTCRIADIKALLVAVSLPESILNVSSIILLSLGPDRPDSLGHFSEKHTQKAAASPACQLPHRLQRMDYTPNTLQDRLGSKTKFIIIRPDFYVFAAAANLDDLRPCLSRLREMCGSK